MSDSDSDSLKTAGKRKGPDRRLHIVNHHSQSGSVQPGEIKDAHEMMAAFSRGFMQMAVSDGDSSGSSGNMDFNTMEVSQG